MKRPVATPLNAEGVPASEGRVQDLDVIIGTPEPGETLDGVTYDGTTDIALFPGDLPECPDSVLEAGAAVDLKFLRFLPPQTLDRNADGAPVLPHIRFDRALDYLIGDRLR